jgi:hypothetical protein
MDHASLPCLAIIVHFAMVLDLARKLILRSALVLILTLFKGNGGEMNRITHVRRSLGTLGLLLVLASAVGCAPSLIVGPLTHQQEERDHLLNRARQAGMSTDLLDRVLPPLTPEEKRLADEQDHSCRSSYLRKDGFTWTGSGLVAAAAGLTIGGAYATGTNDSTGKLIFGVSAGTMAALGSGLVAIGGIIQQRFTDRGCMTKAYAK